MSILNILYVGVAVIVLFGASIFVHEFGHFWVARRCGMIVEEFAIWCGPKIFSWKRKGILYSWRLLPGPIGGFVRLPQMVTSQAIEGKTEGVPPASPFHKILVAIAGPIMNVVFAFFIATIIYFVGLPIAVNPSIIGYVDPKSPEAQMGIQSGDRITAVDGKKVDSWQDVTINTVVARTNVLPVTIEHNGVAHTYQLTAAVDDVAGVKTLNLDPRDHPQVMDVTSDSPAQKAGLKANDKVIAFASVPISGRDQFIDSIKKHGGQQTEMEIERDGKKMTLSITPTLDPVTKIGRIGAVIGSDSTQVYIVQKPGPTPWDQVSHVVNQTFATIGALIHSKQTGVGAKDLSGPIGIFSILAVQLKTDFRLALSFLVLLNINLAILNMMPIPVLDGGHVVLAIIEKIRRRPVSVKFLEYSTTGILVLLISFYIYVTYFDVKRFSLIRAMFQSKAQVQEQQNTTSTPPATAPR
jgi:regulator of sigma E protease